MKRQSSTMFTVRKKSNFNPRLCDKNIIFVIHFSHHASHYDQ